MALIALVWTCLVCVLHGRRVHSSIGPLRDSFVETVKRHSMLLPALHPAAAFAPSNPAAHFSADRAILSEVRRQFGIHFPMMTMTDQERKSPHKSVSQAALTASIPWDRRGFLAAMGVSLGINAILPGKAEAFIAGNDEEISGLVVLRVAEVCQFQEKVLRALATCDAQRDIGITGTATDQFGNSYCTGQTYSVNSQQLIFGTKTLLKNSNLDGNMKLMISTEVPEKDQQYAQATAANIMNTFNELIYKAGKYPSGFKSGEYREIADIYESARIQLVRMFDYLPKQSQDKFYGYADAVRQYEEKVSREDGIERMKL